MLAHAPSPYRNPKMNNVQHTADTDEKPIGVWIVEDHSEYRQTLAYLLDHTAGLKCARVFHDYEELEAVVVGDEPFEPPEVVLMDFHLPGMTGIEGVSRLKAYMPEVPIVMLTICDAAQVIFDALRAGASGYLLKNVSLDHLIAAVREAYNGGTLMPAPVARKVLDFFAETPPQMDYGLTDREIEILRLMGEGQSQKQIAHKLFLSYHTVDSHLRNIYRKLHVSSGIEAVAKAIRERVI